MYDDFRCSEEYRTYSQSIRDIANEIQFNVKQEADAITYYNNLIAHIQDDPYLEPELKNELISKVHDIISEEDKHINLLQEMYTDLTGIVAEDD